MPTPKILITANELNNQRKDPNLVIIDGSWHLPQTKRNGFSEYRERHIPGAHFFDIDEIADKTTNLPHSLPSAEHFADAVGKMGATQESEIVIYDGAGMFSAARVWWMFVTFGAQNVRVLDGGLPAWLAAGYETTDAPSTSDTSRFEASFDTQKIVTLYEMREQVAANETQILDARGKARFLGTQAEPRPGMKSGHMPGAINVPFSSLLNGDGTFKPNNELERQLEKLQVKVDKDTIVTCGSGVTAAIVLFALQLIGKTDTRLYDGSWAEWGSLDDTPVETD